MANIGLNPALICIYILLLTGLQLTDATSAFQKFFENQMHIVAVAAGGGGLILIIIIIVLSCLLCRTFGSNSEGTPDKGAAAVSGTELPVTPVSLNLIENGANSGREKHAKIVPTAAHLYETVNLQSSGEPDVADKSGAQTSTRCKYGSKKDTPNVYINSTIASPESDPDGEDVQGATYAAIDQSTKTKKVDMVDNDLYASRNSTGSSDEQ